MEERRWKTIRVIIWRIAKRKSVLEVYSDGDIAEVFYWAVVHDRPLCWATLRGNWSVHLRRQRKFPSVATLSRRLRTAPMIKLLRQIEVEAMELEVDAPRPLVHYIDGKPLTVSRVSKDRHAGFGWAAGGMAKGYKIHALLGENRKISAWRLTPMNTSEKVMARRMIRSVQPQGYLVGDGNYDDRHLHEICATLGELQLVAPRKKPGSGLGHRKRSLGRLRSIELLEASQTGFGKQLLKNRNNLERRFGWIVTFGGGMACLPPWVRTYPRVRRWVGAKLALATLNIANRKTTYVVT